MQAKEAFGSTLSRNNCIFKSDKAIVGTVSAAGFGPGFGTTSAAGFDCDDLMVVIA